MEQQGFYFCVTASEHACGDLYRIGNGTGCALLSPVARGAPQAAIRVRPTNYWLQSEVRLIHSAVRPITVVVESKLELCGWGRVGTLPTARAFVHQPFPYSTVHFFYIYVHIHIAFATCDGGLVENCSPWKKGFGHDDAGNNNKSDGQSMHACMMRCGLCGVCWRWSLLTHSWPPAGWQKRQLCDQTQASNKTQGPKLPSVSGSEVDVIMPE